MIYDLVPETDEILYKPIPRFNFDAPPINPGELVNNLIETMVHNKGIGISANQCGLPYRCFVLHSEKPFGVFNPILVNTSSELVVLDEGCLSFPYLFVKIKRPKSIKVRFQDYTGEMKTEMFTGMTARCFMHELDHLNGIDYTMRANRIHMERALRQRKNLMRQVKRVAQLDI